MVPSWLSSGTEKSQDTSGINAIRWSLLQSLNLYRARLPGTLTFRDEPPGPDKSLFEIVSRIRNSLDIDSKSINERTTKFVQRNTLKNDSQESCNLNSRTESAIQGLSTRVTNDEKDDVIYAGNCGKLYKRANLNAESLERIRKWGSAKVFTPKIGNVSNDTCIGFNNSQKKVAPTCFPNSSITTTPTNSNNDLWSSSFINCRNIFNLRNDRANILNSKQFSTTNHPLIEPPQELPVNFSESLEDTSTQPSNPAKKEQSLDRQRVNTLKKAKRLLKKVSRDKASTDIDAKAGEKKLKETKIENPYQRIHLSINNYFNSPHESPLISPKRSKLHEEMVDAREKKLSKKNLAKVLAKRKSIGKMIRCRQQIKQIPTTDSAESNDTKSKYRPPLEPELSDNNHPPRNDKIDDKIIELNLPTDCSQASATHGKLNLANNRSMDCQRNKRLKLNHIKKRLGAVLSGERKTVAKPSEILIPQSVRARHIFEPFANIPEQPAMKIQAPKNIKRKPGHDERDQRASAIKTSTDPYLMLWKSREETKSFSTKRTTTYQDSQNSKKIIENYTNTSFKPDVTKPQNDLRLESNIPLLRSKTYIAASKNSDIARMDDNYQHSVRTNTELNEMTGGKQFDNRHSKSLRMLKDLLAITDEDSIAEESVVHSEDKLQTDESLYSTDKSINTIESPSSRKSEVTLSLQAFSKDVEHFDASTETDGDLSLCREVTIDVDKSCDDYSTISNYHLNQTLVDAQVSCSFPTIVSLSDDFTHIAVKSYQMIETQTSRSSFHTSYKEKRDTSVETVRLRLQSKYVNTERCVLIDSSTGKDVLEIQNFCCETQLTNTESTMFDDHSVHDLRVRINGVESQVNALKSLINISIQNTSAHNCADLISSLTNQVVSRGKLSIDNESHGNLKVFPDEVIRAFEIAAEKAQNLHRAIEIYREYEMKKQSELKAFNASNQRERIMINLLREEERKSQSLIVALEHISESEKTLQEDLTKLVLHQEVQFTLETLLDRVVKEAKPSNVELTESIPENDELCDDDIEACWISDFKKTSSRSILSTSSTNILPLVYGAVCTLIFWSLQFSTSCEFG